MSSSQSIKFGTDGWRAIIAKEFTFDNVSLVVQAITNYLETRWPDKSKPVVIGFDVRFLAEEFATHAAQILNKNGWKVLMVERYTPTPVVAFAAKEWDSAGALMFTASHNPPEYMGIKFIPEFAGPATPDITDQIVANVKALSADPNFEVTGTGKADITRFSPFEKYVDFISKQVQFDKIKAANIKWLYDPMHGCGVDHVDKLIAEKTGVKPDMLHANTDPRFGGHLPEPKDEFLGALMAEMAKGQYQVGLANDGDADRFGLVDETGRYFGSDQVIPMLARYLYHQRGYRGNMVRTVATSRLLDALAKKWDVTVYETPVGFKHTGAKMREEPIIIGGEESGGMSILNHIPEKDGVIAISLILEMMAVEGKPISQIYKETQDEAELYLTNISKNLYLADEDKAGLMAFMRSFKVGDTFAGREIKEINAMDGVKFIFDEYEWVLVRPSGTEPILRLYGESPDSTLPAKYDEAVKAAIANLQPAACSV